MQYLVLGANGYIGSYLYRQLYINGKKVFGTRHIRNGNVDCLSFDLLKDSIHRVVTNLDEKEKIAIFCIAQTNINWCYENYNLAYEINVIKTKKVIRELRKNGFYIIFFSTDNVFDGKEGNYTENSKTHGINRYGIMKEEMEHYLLNYEPEVCIFRISKVVSTDKVKQNIFFEWESQQDTGIIRCIKGNILSFVAVEDIYQSCMIAAEYKLHGLYNIVGDRAYSRSELAHIFCKKLGNQLVKIEECNVEEFHFKDQRPLNLSMSNLKFKQETGYRFTSMEKVMQEYRTEK